MQKSEDYRRLAAACLLIADEMKQLPDRAVLIEMAAIWFRLASERNGDAENPPDGISESR